MPTFLDDIFSPSAGLADLHGGVDNVYGSRPRVAPFVPVDLGKEQQDAIQHNLDAYSSITDLINKIIPGFSDLVSSGVSSSNNVLNAGNDVINAAQPLLHGELPPDVASYVQRTAAQRAVQGGYAGTPMSLAGSLRDLGLTSLQAIGQGANMTAQGAGIAGIGANTAQSWTNIAEGAYSPFIVSPSLQAAVTAANNAGQQATDQFRFNVKAAPDPGDQGMFNTDMAIFQQILGTVGGIFGGGMGGLGGAGGGGGGIPPISGSAYAAPGRSWGTPNSYAYNPLTGGYSQSGGGWG